VRSGNGPWRATAGRGRRAPATAGAGAPGPDEDRTISLIIGQTRSSASLHSEAAQRAGLHAIGARVACYPPLMAGSTRCDRARGFSLLELVIVIAIVAALLALALPVLRGVHLRSKKTRELSNLRQVGMAWMMYAQSNNDAALPGYLDPSVQKDWEVVYEYPRAVSGVRGVVGRQIPMDIAAPWTWRLMPFLGDAGALLRGHLGEDDLDMLTLIEHAGDVALEPAFGYNGVYIGGYWTMNSGDRPRGDYRFSGARDLSGRRVNVVVRSPSAVNASERLIVFCSSTLREPGVYARSSDTERGWHLVVPPIVGQTPHWQTPGDLLHGLVDGSQVSLGEGDTFSVEALRATPAPLGRYTGAAAIFYADGHTDSQTPGALADQSKWILGAEKVGDTPASQFTHTEY